MISCNTNTSFDFTLPIDHERKLLWKNNSKISCHGTYKLSLDYGCDYLYIFINHKDLPDYILNAKDTITISNKKLSSIEIKGYNKTNTKCKKTKYTGSFSLDIHIETNKSISVKANSKLIVIFSLLTVLYILLVIQKKQIMYHNMF